MIERFTKSEFEAALPTVAGQALWQYVGLRDGEHCYIVPVRPGVLIFIRSSVEGSGLAADTAKDSIRCWLASDSTGAPLGSKIGRWETRVPGWQARLTEKLRALWRIGRKLKPCPSCGATQRAIKVKKEGPNHGRFYSKCFPCNKFGDWLTKPTQKESNAVST